MAPGVPTEIRPYPTMIFCQREGDPRLAIHCRAAIYRQNLDLVKLWTMRFLVPAQGIRYFLLTGADGSAVPRIQEIELEPTPSEGPVYRYTARVGEECVPAGEFPP